MKHALKLFSTAVKTRNLILFKGESSLIIWIWVKRHWKEKTIYNEIWQCYNFCLQRQDSKYCSMHDPPSGIKRREVNIRIKCICDQSTYSLNKWSHSDVLNDPCHEFLIVQDNRVKLVVEIIPLLYICLLFLLNN